MPNNLHCYQCLATAHLSLLTDWVAGREEWLFPGSTSSGGEGNECLGGIPGGDWCLRIMGVRVLRRTRRGNICA